MEIGSRRFRSELGARVADLVLGDGKASLGTAAYDYSLEQVSGDCYHLLLDGRSFSILVTPVGDHAFDVTVNGKSTRIVVKSEREMLLEQYGLEHGARGGDKSVRAPMPGLVLTTLVGPGDAVQKGDGLLVLEAMKMENEIRAPAEGIVKKVQVAAGDAVGKDDVLVELE